MWMLSWSDFGLLIQAWVFLLPTDAGLCVFSLAGMKRLLGTPCAPPGDPAAQPGCVRRCQRLLNAAAYHHLYPMTCLRKALVLQSSLSRQGIPIELRIGMQREAGCLMGSVWGQYGVSFSLTATRAACYNLCVN
jgi:hypothetical protein